MCEMLSNLSEVKKKNKGKIFEIVVGANVVDHSTERLYLFLVAQQTVD